MGSINIKVVYYDDFGGDARVKWETKEYDNSTTLSELMVGLPNAS